MTEKMSVLQEVKTNIDRARNQIARLTTLACKLAKERDELAEDNTKLQIEVLEWQDEWYKMKVALKNSRKQMIYPKRSQRIKENLKRKK
jgi:hypothetical protein